MDMDAYYDLSTAPAAYTSRLWFPTAITGAFGACWTYVYLELAYRSWAEKTYSLSLVCLCLNLSWEVTYGVVVPVPSRTEQAVLAVWVVTDGVVIINAVRYAAREWRACGRVRDNIVAVFAVGMALCLAGQVAFAMSFPQDRAVLWSAAFCQVVGEYASLAQLVSRGSSRGTSWSVWWARFIGNVIPPIGSFWRAYTWPEAYGWLHNPFLYFAMAATLIGELANGWLLLVITREERREKEGKGKRE